MMELRQLLYFVAAGEDQNFNRAAARLHLAQPALSRQIRALEDELGFLLFERRKRGVVLTPAGASLLKDSKSLLEDLALAKDRAKELDSGQAGALHIGFNAAASTSKVFMEAIHSFKQILPHVTLDLQPMTSPAQMEGILSGKLDAGLLYLIDEVPEIESCLISDYTLLLGMRYDNPLSKRKTIHLLDLVDQDFIWYGSGRFAFMQDFTLAACRRQGLEPRIVQEVADPETQIGLILAGVGLCFLHSSIRERHHPDLVIRDVADFHPSLPLSLVWHQSRYTGPLTRFATIVTQLLEPTVIPDR